jgi:signal transduction histidine kinase
MAVTQLSPRESLHWLDWFVRVRRALLAGVCLSIVCGAALLYVDLRMRGAVTAIVVVFSLAAPYVVLLVTLLKALSIASSMAYALRHREQQLAAARRELGRREGRNGSAAPGDPASPEALATIAHDLREPLHLIESNVAVLSEAFGDILPVLDQHEAAGPHIRVARLDYPFFRDRVPVMLQDLTTGAARIAGLLREVTSRARPAAPRRPETAQVDAR